MKLRIYALSRYVNIFPIQLSSQRKIKFNATEEAKRCFKGIDVESLEGEREPSLISLMEI